MAALASTARDEIDYADTLQCGIETLLYLEYVITIIRKWAMYELVIPYTVLHRHMSNLTKSNYLYMGSR